MDVTILRKTLRKSTCEHLQQEWFSEMVTSMLRTLHEALTRNVLQHTVHAHQPVFFMNFDPEKALEQGFVILVTPRVVPLPLQWLKEQE